MSESDLSNGESLWLGTKNWCSAGRWREINEAAILLEWGNLRASDRVSAWRRLAMDWPVLCFGPTLAVIAAESISWLVAMLAGEGATARGLGFSGGVVVLALAMTRSAEAHALARRHCEWVLAQGRLSWLDYAAKRGADADALRSELIRMHGASACVPGAMAACVSEGQDDLRDESSYKWALALAKIGGGWKRVSEFLNAGYPSLSDAANLDAVYFQAELSRREARELDLALGESSQAEPAGRLRLFASRENFM